MSRRRARGEARFPVHAPWCTLRRQRTLNPALAQPLTPDEQLSEVVGNAPLPRPQVVKKLWAYIKTEGLQDKENRRMINADDKLRPLFGGKKKVNMFEMTKLVAAHMQ